MSMTAFVIEKGIPLPEGWQAPGKHPRTYRWEDLEISDSVLVPTYEAARAGQAWARRHSLSFIFRKEKDGSGWRVWRTE